MWSTLWLFLSAFLNTDRLLQHKHAIMTPNVGSLATLSIMTWETGTPDKLTSSSEPNTFMRHFVDVSGSERFQNSMNAK
jgi:hypothetical protein